MDLTRHGAWLSLRHGVLEACLGCQQNNNVAENRCGQVQTAQISCQKISLVLVIEMTDALLLSNLDFMRPVQGLIIMILTKNCTLGTLLDIC